MSHGKLREDKTCQNCGDDVTVQFCPTCGQENTETKKSFHYLFTHFIEDLVHYDNSFWKAIKYLLYTPATLSIIYLFNSVMLLIILLLALLHTVYTL